MNSIITEIVAFGLGGVLGAFLKTLLDYKKEILSRLWEKRFEEYKTVWQITKILRKYPKDKKVTYSDLRETSIKLEEWYYGGGGVLMSKETQDAFNILQSKLNNGKYDIEGADNDYQDIYILFSRFRTNLSKDLSARSNKFLEF